MHINSISNVHTDLLVVDIIITLLCVLVFLHVKFITKLEGLLVVLTIVSMAILAEELSIQLGETHCHFEATMMLAKCSSLNSVFFYVPWMYSCWAAGSRISTKTIFGKYLSIGLLHPIFCVLYELTGINIGWFFWGSKISALQTRVYQVPVMAVCFHFAFGVCMLPAQDLARRILYKQVAHAAGATGAVRYQQTAAILQSQRTAFSCVLEVALAALVAPTLALAFDIPTFVCETFLGIDRTLVVGIMLALAAAYLLLDKAGVIPGEAVPYSLQNAAEADWLLLAIPGLFVTFIVLRNVYHVTTEGGWAHHRGLARNLADGLELFPFRLPVLLDSVLAIVSFTLCCLGAGGKSPRGVARPSLRDRWRAHRQANYDKAV